MNFCKDCKSVFEDDEVEEIRQPHPYGDTIAYETFGVCPNCKSSNFNETDDALAEAYSNVWKKLFETVSNLNSIINKLENLLKGRW